MGKSNYLILFLGLFLGLFFVSVLLSPQKVKAADSDVVINEVMVDPSCLSDKCEWIELYNNGASPVNLKNWTIDDTKKLLNDTIIQPYDYLVVTKNLVEFNNIWTVDPNKIIELTSLVLSNSGHTLKLKNSLGSYEEDFTWPPSPKTDISWEKIDPLKTGDGNWGESLVTGGTPGAKNSAVILPPPPSYPEEVLGLVNLEGSIIRQVQVSSIVDGDTIKVTGLEGFPSTIRLLFVDTPEENQPFYEPAKDFTRQLLGQTVDLIISEDLGEQKDRYERTLAVIIFQDKVFNTQLLEQGLASFYDIENSVLLYDAWLEIIQQAQRERIGLWESAGKIILSELLPDPVGLDSEGEWVEIYNPTDDSVVLTRFLLDQYLIPPGLTVGPQSYYVFHRNQTGVVLSNTTGDTVKLFFPGGLILNETSYGPAEEGVARALSGGIWQWTTTSTVGEINIITSALEDVGGNTDEKNQDIPVNKDPVEIKTGDFRNFENYLVNIQGTVTETSGNTFYLDDGSGKAKVYIQAATNIEKPEMHKGDTFQVCGIVNLYRDTWRILPQKQDDIKLIQAVQKDVEIKSSTAKKSTAATASAKKTLTSSNATARSPTSSSDGKIASADSISDSVKVEGLKSPWWVQLTKAIIGLAIIFFLVLSLKIFRDPKDKPLGGDFGDET
ncbi:MAG: Nucleic acid binding OB-fold tRNA/helicase-type [Candidatus Berkelbacteria bacterium]|nr:Nucleic acid binding OB-fold tRNA/helicase-type [Candidatus Berkelbacteria bacterium]